ncbi:MAG: hypothetical protein RPU90_11050 [Candidatus Sedimenticola sp. (ex Thyasira tokunagai)]
MVLRDISAKKIPSQKCWFVLAVENDMLTIHQNVELKPKLHLRLKLHTRSCIGVKDAFKHGAVGWHMSQLLFDALQHAGASQRGIDTVIGHDVVEENFRAIWDRNASDTEGLSGTPPVKLVRYFAASIDKTAIITFDTIWPEFTAVLR